MKKTQSIIVSIVGVVLVLCLVLGIRFGTVYADAKYIRDNLDFTNFTYKADVVLDESKVSTTYKVTSSILGFCAGLDKEQMYHPYLEGSKDGGDFYVKVYPKDADKPITELFAGNDKCIVNGGMVYDTVRDNVVDKMPLLGAVITEWRGTDYLSLQQVRELLGTTDDDDLRFSFPTAELGLDVKEIFQILTGMQKTNGDKREYAFENEQIRIGFAVDRNSPVEMFITLKQPGELQDILDKELAALNVKLPETILKSTSTIDLRITCQESKIMVPEDVIDSANLERILAVKKTIDKLLPSGE